MNILYIYICLYMYIYVCIYICFVITIYILYIYGQQCRNVQWEAGYF